MLKLIPDNVQKSLKSDVPDFGKSSKTIVLSSIFVVSTHVPVSYTHLTLPTN